MEEIKNWNKQIANLIIPKSIDFVCSKIQGKKVFSTSFGIEDQMITYILSKLKLNVEVFTLDTGRMFLETYDVFDQTQQKYKNIQIKTYFPDKHDIKQYVTEEGINGFYRSIESRKNCCFIRKVKPLQKALEGASLWITGLRAEQSDNRCELQYLEWDENNKIIKYNPLLNHSLSEVENFIEKNTIPINKLYKRGFVSIGCAPCTRAIKPGENFRDGRWWWETSNKECGLHKTNEKIT